MSDQSSGVRYARNKVPNKPSKTGGGKTSSESADPIRAGLGKSVPQSDEKAPEKYSEKHEKHSGKSDKHSDKSVKHAGKGLRTSASEMESEVPGSPEITEATSDELGEDPKDPVFVPVSVPQGITSFETQDNAGFQKAVNQLAGSINPPFVLGIQGRPGTSTDNGSTFGAQGINPGSNQPFCPPRPVDMQPPRSGYPQWPPYQQQPPPQQWSDSQQPWYPPSPCGPYGQGYGYPPPNQQQYQQQYREPYYQPRWDTPPPSRVVTTQPTSTVSTVATVVAPCLAWTRTNG